VGQTRNAKAPPGMLPGGAFFVLHYIAEIIAAISG
jgi:hypothetical protein